MDYQIVDKKPGRPRLYEFDTLEVGGEQIIRCRPKSRDGKLKSARTALYSREKDGKEFIVKPIDIGVLIKREA